MEPTAHVFAYTIHRFAVLDAMLADSYRRSLAHAREMLALYPIERARKDAWSANQRRYYQGQVRKYAAKVASL